MSALSFGARLVTDFAPGFVVAQQLDGSNRRDHWHPAMFTEAPVSGRHSAKNTSAFRERWSWRWLWGFDSKRDGKEPSQLSISNYISIE